MAYIQCEDLILGYEGTPVAQHINFSVAQGDYLCIVGENGAGKSTLMKTLLGLTPLMGGRIVYGDGLEAHAIGYLPQQTFVQKDFPASVWEIVLSGTLSQCGWRPFFSEGTKTACGEKYALHGYLEFKKGMLSQSFWWAAATCTFGACALCIF